MHQLVVSAVARLFATPGAGFPASPGADRRAVVSVDSGSGHNRPVRLEPGVEGSATLMVTDEDTAAALGSGDVVVLGTPRVVALCEAATVTAIAGGLREEQTAVGTRVEIDHLLPSTVGAVVTARARLVEVDGRRLVFDVEAREGDRIVARGRVTRAVVDRARFAAATDGSPSDADV